MPGRVTVIAVVASTGGVLFGYNTGVIAGSILFVRAAFHLSDLMVGVVTGIALAGAGVGAAVSGQAADRFGRRPMLLLIAVVFVLGALVCATAGSLGALLAGRLIIGLGVGGASVVTPLYLSEIAPASRRGGLVSFNQLAMTIGILVSNLVGFAFAGSGDWRAMLVCGGVPGLLLAAAIPFLPETPLYLARRGVVAPARDPPVPAAMRGPLLIGVGLAIFQQATGINTVIYFAPVIFRAAGLSSASAALAATAGIGAINVIMTLAAIALLDRVGRRPLLLTGLAGMAISLIVLATGFLLGGAARGVITEASLAAYIGAFAIGLGPVFWVLIAEIFPLAQRGRGMAIATAANWITNLIVAASFVSLLSILGRPALFLTYATLTFAALVFAWRLVPETKGLVLEVAGFRK